MDGFSVGKILAGLRNPEIYLKKLKQIDVNAGESGFNTSLSQPKANVIQSLQSTAALMHQLQMNQIASMDRAVYIRNLLGLPQTLGGILQAAQNLNSPLNNTSLLLNDLNESLLKNQQALAQIFGESGAAQNQSGTKDAVMLFFNGMIHMPAISELILQNSKHRN